MEKSRRKRRLKRPHVILAVFVAAILLVGENLLELSRDWLSLERLLQVSQGIFHDIVFLLLSIALIILVTWRQRNTRLDPIQIAALVAGLELYAIARLGKFDAFLVRFDACHVLAYGDALALPALWGLIRHTYFLLSPSKPSTLPAVARYDASLGDGPDLFGYGNLAQRVKAYLIDPKSPSSGTIGINGVFGIGKTSFFDLLTNDLKDTKVRVIRFTPWRSSSKSFLSQLVDTLTHSDLGEESEIVSALEDYESMLSQAKIPSGLGRLLTAQPRFTNSEVNAKQLVDQLLRKHQYRFVVVVDDLDRLLPAEIVDVLKLLRNTADFDQITYLLAYDKVVVEESLKQLQPIGTEFLDKFIEAELVLPSIEPSTLINLCFSELQKLLPELTRTFTPEVFIIATKEHLGRYVRTPRQAKRLALSTKLLYAHLSDDLYLPDVVLLQALRLRYPKVVNLLARQHKLILTADGQTTKGGPLFTLSEDAQTKKLRLADLLETESSELGIVESDLANILEVVKGLFPSSSFPHQSHFYSIRYPRNLWRYLNYEIPGNALSQKEYRRVLSSSANELDVALNEALVRDQTMSLCIRIGADTTSDPVHLLTIQLALARCETLLRENSFSMTSTWFDWVRELLYRASKPEESTKATEVLLRYLESATYPAEYERDLLRGILNTEISLFELGECFARLTGYIRTVIHNEPELNRTVVGALFDCVYDGWGEDRGGMRSGVKKAIPQAAVLFAEACERFGSQPYLNLLVEKNWRSEPPNLTFAVRQVVAIVFESWNGFEQHVQSLPDDPFVREFSAFYSVFAAGEHKKYVPFAFQHLKP